MADVNTIRTAAGARAADIDAGLRAHMNKVYGTMSVGMLITFAAAWAIAGLAVTTDPSQAVGQLREGEYLTSIGYALYASPLKWVVMFAPLAFVFGFGAAINRMSAATAQTVFTYSRL
jgi:FtsH-binding integral membrane protein